MAIGRISGPLLKANLLRDGVDLAFENDLIYLDVSDPNPANHRVGIKNSSPSYTFDVNGTTRTTNLLAGLADIDDVNINDNKIKSSVGNLIIEAATLTDRVQIGAANIPNIYGDVRIEGNLHTTGNITADGDITIGDQDTDSIILNADVKSNITPDATDTYSLGTALKRWLQLNVNNANIGDVAIGTNLIESIGTNQDLYVTANGTGNVIINDLFSVGGSGAEFTGTDFTVGNLFLNGDELHTGVSSIATNTDFYVAANGTGNIYLQSNVVAEQDLAVNGGDLTTTSTTFNLLNTTATTVNFAGAGTSVTIGNNTGSLTLRNPTIVGVNTTQDLFNTVATTVNFAGAATDIQIGSATGTTNINNNLDVDGDVNIAGGDIRTTSPTFNLINDTATVVNFAGQGTLVNIGGETGKTNIKNNLDVDGDVNIDGGDLTVSTTTFNLANTTATTVNFAGAATDIQIGSASGTTNINNNLDVDGDVNIDGGDLTVSTTTFNLANTTATTVNFAGAATDIQIGSATGTTTVNNDLQVDGKASITSDLSVDGNVRLGNQNTDTIDIPAEFISSLIPDVSATYSLGTALKSWNNIYVSVLDNGNIRISNNLIATTLSNSNLELDAAGTGTIELKTNSNIIGTLGVTQDVTLDSDLAVNGGDLTTTAEAFNLVNDTATTVNFAGAATSIQIGSSTGTTTIKNENVVLDGDLSVNGGDLTTTSTTFNLLTTNATTVNFADVANNVNIAKLDSLTTIKGNLDVNQQATLASVNVEDLTATRVVFAGVDGELVDNAGFTFDGTTLQLTGNINVDTQATFASANIEDLTNTRVIYAGVDGELVDNAGFTFDGTTLQLTGNINVDTQATFASVNVEDLTSGRVVLAGTLGELVDNANLTFNGTKLTVTGDQHITGDLDIDGDIRIGGNITVGNQTTDTITVVADFTSNLIPDEANTYDIGTATKYWKTLFAATFDNGNIVITNNSITTTDTNSDISIGTNGTGYILLQDNTSVTGDIFVNGTSSTINGITISGTTIDSVDSIPITIVPETTFNSDVTIDTNLDVTNKVTADIVEVTGQLIVSGTETIINSENIVLQDGLIYLGEDNPADVLDLGFVTSFTSDHYQHAGFVRDATDGIWKLFRSVETEPTTIIAFNEAEYDTLMLGDLIDTSLTQNRVVYVGVNGKLIDSSNFTFNGTTLTVTGDQHITGNLDVDTQATLASVNVEDLTATRVVYAGTNGELVDNAGFTFDGTTLQLTGNINVDTQATFASANIEDLTSGRVVLAGTLGELVDNANLTFNGTKLTVTGDQHITGDLDIDGDIRIGGDITVGNQPLDTITVVADFTSDLVPQTSSTYNLGSAGKTWLNLYADNVNVAGIKLDTNVISTVNSNADLIIRPDGSGTVYIDSDQALKIPVGDSTVRPAGITGQIRFNTDTNQFEGFQGTAWSSLGGVRDVDGNTYIIPESAAGANENTLYFYTDGNLSATLDSTRFDTIRITVDDIAIDGNVIETVTSNTNLELRANGTGYVTFTDTSAIKLPVGTTAERLSGTTGQVRFNTDTTQFEGYNGIAWSSLGGVRDVDGNTYIIPELNSGSNENTLYFYTDGVLTATFDKNYNKFFAAGLQIPTGDSASRPIVPESGSIRFNTDTTQFEGYNGVAWSSLGGVRDVDGNTYIVPELSSGSNENTLYFYTDGVLSATLDKFEFNLYDQIFRNNNITINDNRIETYTSDTDLVLAAQGAGIVYIDSTSAIKIPAGTNAERPGAGTFGGAGWIRWNTDINSLEAWNGTIYQPVGGGSSSDANADTRLTFETAGNNEDIIRFYAGVAGPTPGSTIGSNEIMTVSNDGLIVSNTVRIFQNVIENINTNEDLIIRASGTGRVIIDGTGGAEGSVFVTDPLLTINSGAVGNNVYDTGLIFERGDLINKGFIYDESADEFAVISTIEQGTVKGNVAIAGYENIAVASVKLKSETANKVTFTDADKIVRTLDSGRIAYVDGVMKFTTFSEVAIPTGTSAERPNSPQEGTIRYNTDQQYFEGYAQGTWQGLGFGAASAPTYQGFVADGNDYQFVLDQYPLSSAGIMVAINGVVQEPEIAYTVVGNVLTFIDESDTIYYPDAGDRIDVRFLTKPAVSTVRTSNFIADGSTNSFDTGYPIDNEETVLVFVNSIYQDTPVYSISGSVVTFDETPYADDRINIVNIAAIVAPNLPTKTYVDQQDTIISNNATDDAIAFAIALG